MVWRAAARYSGNMSDPVETFPLTWARALWAAIGRMNRNNGFVMASHVAMSVMLAVFPFILFVVALAGAMTGEVEIDDLIQIIFGVWPDDIAAPIVAEIRAVVKTDSTSLMTLGGLVALYFASNGVDAVRIAISSAYRDYDPRPFWKTRFVAVVFVLVGGGLIIVGLTVGVGLPAYFRYIAEVVPDPVENRFSNLLNNDSLKFVVTLTFLTFAVSACHIWLPGLRHRFVDVWPGVGLTIALWIAAVWGFSLYIAYFADYNATYAGLAGAMAALIFLYLIAVILIFGAEFNGALLRGPSKR